MIRQGLCDTYLLELLSGTHLSSNTYKIALYTSSADLGPETTAYSATNEVSGAGYSAGGMALTGFTAANVTSGSIAISGITRAGSVATATSAAHGLCNGEVVTVAGAAQTEYNITAQISNVAANTFDYTISGAPATPATGTITFTYKQATLDFTTDPAWTTATITANGALIYNSSVSNKAVMVLAFGSDITSTAGTFTVTLPAATLNTALIRL